MSIGVHGVSGNEHCVCSGDLGRRFSSVIRNPGFAKPVCMSDMTESWMG